ncbi:MAG TPA: hypothetical protein V6D14_15605 [Coleofasciculaceae cyanobacterium]
MLLPLLKSSRPDFSKPHNEKQIHLQWCCVSHRFCGLLYQALRCFRVVPGRKFNRRRAGSHPRSPNSLEVKVAIEGKMASQCEPPEFARF